MPSAPGVELFETPSLADVDLDVLARIHRIRQSLAGDLRSPRRWNGLLRRTSAARAIRGSNTIEGYTVSTEDAVAAVDDEPPLTTDETTWAEITGYRRVLTYVLNVATEPGFVVDENVLRSMHFMLLEHDLSKTPGRYRTTEIYVRDDERGTTEYIGPEPTLVPPLMRELAKQLVAQHDDPLVHAAMAHLNMVTIHPFRDGNGRMARALQTMALARDSVLEPEFSSIEEWLGRNTRDYYDILAYTGRGSWQPHNDALMWLRFNLRAHHMQAQTLQRRFEDADYYLRELDALLEQHKLPDRIDAALLDAVIGLRVTRPSYVKQTSVDERTGTRDLAAALNAGLLEARGERRGRYYVAGTPLQALRAHRRETRKPLVDPYPDLMSQVRRNLG